MGDDLQGAVQDAHHRADAIKRSLRLLDAALKHVHDSTARCVAHKAGKRCL